MSTISSLGLSSVFAQQSYGANNTTSPFKKADTDGSGGVSFEEFTALGQNLPDGGVQEVEKVQEMFDQIDADGDGIISSEEDSDFHAKMSEETQSALLQIQEETDEEIDSLTADDIFAKLDIDGDGSITSDELAEAFSLSAEAASELLSEVDTDGDGVISEAENEAHIEEMEANKQASAPPPPPPSGGGQAEETEEDDEEDALTGLFSQMDTNGDGSISASELSAFMSVLNDSFSEESNFSVMNQATKSYSAASEYFSSSLMT